MQVCSLLPTNTNPLPSSPKNVNGYVPVISATLKLGISMIMVMIGPAMCPVLLRVKRLVDAGVCCDVSKHCCRRRPVTCRQSTCSRPSSSSPVTYHHVSVSLSMVVDRRKTADWHRYPLHITTSRHSRNHFSCCTCRKTVYDSQKTLDISA